MRSYLSALQEDIIACSVCSYKYCRNVCAVYDVLRSDGVAPSGFNHFALGILQGMTDYTPSAAEALYKCSDCGACRVHGCVAPGYGEPIDTPNIILALRAEATERNIIPDGVRILLDDLRAANSPYADSADKRTAWIPSSMETGRPAPVYLWAGCSGHRHRDALHAAARLLQATSQGSMLDLGTLGAEEGCCGLLAWQLGDRALAVQQARTAIQSLAEKRVRELVVAESGCYRLFKALAPQAMGLDVPFAVYHLSEYLDRLADTGHLKLNRPVAKVVAYHDAGQLGAHMGIYDAPRSLLGRVPGLQLVETPYNRTQTRGSGQGAGLELLHPETAYEIARRRLEEASRVGAEWLVTACPAEAGHLAAVANAGPGGFPSPVQVRELSQVLIDAAQEQP